MNEKKKKKRKVLLSKAWCYKRFNLVKEEMVYYTTVKMTAIYNAESWTVLFIV